MDPTVVTNEYFEYMSLLSKLGTIEGLLYYVAGFLFFLIICLIMWGTWKVFSWFF